MIEQQEVGEAFSRPDIFGIVNVTDDSFSDGGRYLQANDAIMHAHHLLEAGADVIELGAASSHPDSLPVTVEEERRRLAPVLKALVEDGVSVSVDSTKPEVHEFAIEMGVDHLNDIRGFPEASTCSTLARVPGALVVMHSVSIGDRAKRTSTDENEIWHRIFTFFDSRIEALSRAGISREKLVLDPGLGFFLGDTPEPSFAVLGNINQLKQRYEVPVMISASRKSFLQRTVGRAVNEVGVATLAAEIWASCHGVDIVRTHDVAALADALRVLEALQASRRR